MTLSSSKLSTQKLGSSSTKAITSIIALSVLSMSALFTSSSVLANSCNKSDIDFYLQRGFTNDQVVQLCSGTAGNQNTGQQTQTFQQPTQAQIQQTQQNNQLREDQSYLSAALNTDGVTMTPQGLTVLSEECFKHKAGDGKASLDLVEKLCANTKTTINFTGMKIGRASRGIILIKNAVVNIKGNIQRELLDVNNLRRQDRPIVRKTLSATPKSIKLKIRRGIAPTAVANLLRRYEK